MTENNETCSNYVEAIAAYREIQCLCNQNAKLREELSLEQAARKVFEFGHKEVLKDYEALQATVEKLPKTADGVVLLGDIVIFGINGYGEVVSGKYGGYDSTESPLIVVLIECPNHKGNWLIPIEECYSTREAAGEAKQ